MAKRCCESKVGWGEKCNLRAEKSKEMEIGTGTDGGAMSIARRRHHNRRIKEKRKGYWSDNNDKRNLGRILSTPQLCSCRGCGNQRKWEGVTQQEKKAALKLVAGVQKVVSGIRFA